MTDNLKLNLDDSSPISNMPFLDHIEELRWRLIKSFLAIMVCAVVGYIFADRLFNLIIYPLGDIELHYTEITGSFYAYLKIALYVGIIGAIPIIFYQLWRFISPGLYSKEKRMIIPMVLFSTLLFLTGASFCFFIVLPFTIKFLVGYGSDILTPVITISSYISFAGMLLLAFGFAFELPVAGYFLGRMGIVSSKTLTKGRPFAVVIFLVFAAVLTPPDIISQLLLAGPMLLLYEITIWLVKATGKKQD
jgi:sec-independent protein translocase protein TatC